MLCFIYRAPIVVELHEVTQHVFFTHEHLGVSWLALQLVQIVLHSAVATILLLQGQLPKHKKKKHEFNVLHIALHFLIFKKTVRIERRTIAGNSC